MGRICVRLSIILMFSLVVIGFYSTCEKILAQDGGTTSAVNCGDCEDKVTQLTLKYNGSDTARVEVNQNKDRNVFNDDTVLPDEMFTFFGIDKKGTLGKEIKIFVNGILHTKIHTSCSKPIGPGLVSGDFEVVEGYSRNGGLLCSVDDNGDGTECTGAPVAKTGQTTCYDENDIIMDDCTGTGQDGEKQAGVDWPNPRFTDNGDGTITDNLTGLIWLKNANSFVQLKWSDALNACNSLYADGFELDDGSVAGDWRLPNVRELSSLIHYGFSGPALSDTAGTGQGSFLDIEGDPFSNVQRGSSSLYWSSTTAAFPTNGSRAWLVIFEDGNVSAFIKNDNEKSVWCVRGP